MRLSRRIQGITSISGAQASTSSKEGTLQAAKLLQGVEKSYDSGKKLLDESRIVESGGNLEEDSEPTVNEPGKGYDYHRRVAVDELFGRMSEKGFEDFSRTEY